MSSCWGHLNGVKFGCWEHRNRVKFGRWGHRNGVKFGCWGHRNRVRFQFLDALGYSSTVPKAPQIVNILDAFLL